MYHHTFVLLLLICVPAAIREIIEVIFTQYFRDPVAFHCFPMRKRRGRRITSNIDNAVVHRFCFEKEGSFYVQERVFYQNDHVRKLGVTRILPSSRLSPPRTKTHNNGAQRRLYRTAMKEYFVLAITINWILRKRAEVRSLP